ncbi:MAG TPA: phosphoesterase [Patescibacteria group bacterium]|nr:phosphoesterase [Patescibacteria group bacterium]
MVATPIQVRLFFHDKCFDGAASAAVFTRFYRERIRADAQFHYTGMTHRARHPFTPEMFDGDENAIVDFKYSSSPKLTWWFDHHQSAFLSPEDAAHFQNDHSGKKFYNPEYHSCTKLLADVASKQFGFNAAPLDELVRWGDIIDGAQYPDAATAVGLAEPAMKLALVIEAAPQDDLVPQLIPEIARRRMAEMIELPAVKKHLGPLLERHERSLELFRKRARAEDGVVYFDLSGDEMEGYNKFIPYYLFPNAIYSVGVSASPLRVKVSVGSNPWTKEPLRHNLAALCERYGGGGHARVAAISLEPGDVAHAQKVARAITEELRH